MWLLHGLGSTGRSVEAAGQGCAAMKRCGGCLARLAAGGRGERTRSGAEEGRCRDAGSRSAAGSKAGSQRGRSQAAARRCRGVERRVRGATACGAGEGGWHSAARGWKANGNARCAAVAPHQAEYPARRETRSADRRGAVKWWARGSALVGAARVGRVTRHCAPPVLGRGSDGRAEDGSAAPCGLLPVHTADHRSRMV